MANRGYVSLVGAGPGDPGLLTRKAAIALRRADLVLYDALVDERVVALARRAQRFYVGKRAGRHALSQHEIQAVLVSQAKRGRRVVRLKGGDPFVFGRGGEEAQALERAGIAYEVIPGVSSAIAAPASAGIPVTHRDHASGFLVVSGHDEQVFVTTVHALKPNGVTVVILMGFGRRVELAQHLLSVYSKSANQFWNQLQVHVSIVVKVPKIIITSQSLVGADPIKMQFQTLVRRKYIVAIIKFHDNTQLANSAVLLNGLYPGWNCAFVFQFCS